MRVVLAPDSFGGVATASDAVECLSDGWRSVDPGVDTVTCTMSDGGPGFVEALAFQFPRETVLWCDATGPLGEPSGCYVVQIGTTAYIESALVCGLHLIEPARRRGATGDVRTASTYGVGQAVAFAARQPGVERIVIGLGGSGTNDGGAGLWAALGAEPADMLRGGGIALRTLETVTPPPDPGVELVAATDVDNRLLGLNGATAIYGPQKGADHSDVMALEGALEQWANVVEATVGRPGLRREPGSGAAGGLGFGLLALGATRLSGADLVIDLVGLREAVEGADLVITGEGRFDATSLRGKVVTGVARVAAEAGVPVVVAAGQSSVGEREAAAHGYDEVWSVADLLGSADAALAAGQDGIRQLGAEIARTWSR